jgi:hypothetical protein
LGIGTHSGAGQRSGIQGRRLDYNVMATAGLLAGNVQSHAQDRGEEHFWERLQDLDRSTFNQRLRRRLPDGVPLARHAPAAAEHRGLTTSDDGGED